MTPLTVLDKVVEALQGAGATEEIIAAAVKAGGEFGDSPPRPNGRPRKYADHAARTRAWRRRYEIRNEIPAPDAPRYEIRNEIQPPRDEIRNEIPTCFVSCPWPAPCPSYRGRSKTGLRGLHGLSMVRGDNPRTSDNPLIAQKCRCHRGNPRCFTAPHPCGQPIARLGKTQKSGWIAICHRRAATIGTNQLAVGMVATFRRHGRPPRATSAASGRVFVSSRGRKWDYVFVCRGRGEIEQRPAGQDIAVVADVPGISPLQHQDAGVVGVRHDADRNPGEKLADDRAMP